MPSVLVNLDILISPDTSVKHVADLTKTPLIELSLGRSPYLKQGSVCSDNLILTPTFNYKYNAKETLTLPSVKIKAKDILVALDHYYGEAEYSDYKLGPNLTLYKSRHTNHGMTYHYELGVKEDTIELMTLASRSLIFLMNEMGNKAIEVVKYIRVNYTRDRINELVHEEGEGLRSILRELLQSLRMIDQIKSGEQRYKDLYQSFEKVLSFCHDEGLVSIPVLIFRSKIESLEQNGRSGINMLEDQLFKLKNQLKQISKLMELLTSREDFRPQVKRETEIH